MQNKLVIALPMAGWGTRMRPHTWNKPKVLCRVAGATTLDYVLREFEPLHQHFSQVQYVFIVSNEDHHAKIAAHIESHHPTLQIDYVFQTIMEGQSKALKLAQEYFDGPMLMAFADTLIDADFSVILEDPETALAWCVKVNDPQHYGVVHLDPDQFVDYIVEKPQEYIGNLAMAGTYYFPSGKQLISAIDRQIERNIRKNPDDPNDHLTKEFYLVPAINIMLAEDDRKMRVIDVPGMHDTGRPEAMVKTNQYLLKKYWQQSQEHFSDRFGEDVIITPPVFIGEGVSLTEAIIGPNVSIGDGTTIKNAEISHAVIGENCEIECLRMKNSLVGDHVTILDTKHSCKSLNLGDNAFSFVEQRGEERIENSVECHSSATYAERPIAFHWADSRLEIDAILSRWRTQFGRGFRVRVKDDREFTLFYDEGEDTWTIEIFSDTH
ncbi:MAG: sugar phosphate nucleotidyltransferase [Anaerolineae bacterium]|jgi:glucose-1-phosphate thymidylyltransferase|nr:sugar phosphate nucleotidyltransferase [Anaerolineae bacterium]